MSSKYKFTLIGIVFVILGLLLVPQSLLENLAHKYIGARPENFLILETVGRVEKKSQGGDHFSPLEAKDSVLSGDTVITHGDSKVLFNFDPPFWLMPYSKMEFSKKDGGWVGYLSYGEVKKLATVSRNEKIALFHDDKLIETEQYSSAEETLIAATVPVTDTAFKEIPASDSAPQNVIEKQIFQTLLLHKKFFQGCFIKYYKTKSGDIRGGESVFDLLIDVTGAIEKATVTRSDIQDPEYLECLKLVFSRIRFKNLPLKEPLHALFPLNVDMPQQ